MKKEIQNQINSFQELFNATGHPVFKTISLYIKREHKIISLDGFGLEKTNQEELML